MQDIIKRLDRIVDALTAPPREYVDIDGAAEFLGMGRSTLDQWRIDREGPTFIRVGKSRVMYALADLRAFMTANRVEALS